MPILAAEIPSHENGGVARDGLSVTWDLRTDVKWHDGVPFTADDIVFNQALGPIGVSAIIAGMSRIGANCTTAYQRRSPGVIPVISAYVARTMSAPTKAPAVWASE